MPEKAVNVTPIFRVNTGQPETSVPYMLLDKAIAAWHPHLQDAHVVIEWRRGWTADKDGKLRLGTMRKRGDSERNLVEYDAVLTLNEEAWEHLDERGKLALIDHECCHLQVQEDEETDDGKKYDENGRVCYRIRKHDIEEFQDVVSRHGCYKNDLEAFVRAAIDKSRPSLFREAE